MYKIEVTYKGSKISQTLKKIKRMARKENGEIAVGILTVEGGEEEFI